MRDTYLFQDYVHDYAVWTAARAVQRKFTTTQNVKKAIDRSGLRAFSEARRCDTVEEFNNFHRLCANQLIEAFRQNAVNNATYGKAAKIIAIYLKTSVMIPTVGQGAISQFIHPPIDRFLLTNLCREHHIKKLCERGWTSLTEDEYWNLCERLKQEGLQFDWTLERYWHPEQEKDRSDEAS